MSNHFDFKKCAICELDNPEPKHFWTIHKQKEALYYEQYYPKFDLLTNEKLKFKDRDSYILNNFSNKLNLKKWFKSQNIETQQNYLKESLIKRRNLKNWTYTPTQVELRSCPEMVGIKTFNEIFPINYYKLCEELGYISRKFENINEKTILKETRDLRGNPILVDSREQSLINFGNKEINITTLPVGDYSIKNNNYNIYVERKSLKDLISTFGPKNFDRFERELQKAAELGLYIILLVETDINTALNFEYSAYYNKHTHMTSIYLFHQIRMLLQKYTNWQIAFCNGREDMKKMILHIFKTEEFWANRDLQLGIDYKFFRDGI